MSSTRTDLPSPSAPNFEQRVRETLMTYLGRQGNPLDRGLTLRDLIDAGIVSLRPGTQLGPGTTTLPIELGDAFDEDLDLTPPPTPTGFALTAAISNVIVEHDAPTYTQGRGHLRTRVYAATWVSGPLPTIAQAVEVGQFTGNLWALASNPATTWRVWIRWESRDGAIGPPAGGTNGLAATTGQDVTTLLQALASQISESQLASALGSRINLIDAPVTGLVTQVGNANAAIQQEAIVRADADNGLLAQYTVKIDVAGHVSGFGLASTLNNATPTSDFLVRADRFAVMPVSVVQATAPTANLYRGFVWRDTSVNPAVTRYWTGSAWTTTPQVLPFVVVTNSGTINGVTVGPGVYIDTAYVADATITRAKIGLAAIDTARIADAAIVNAKISDLDASKINAGFLSADRIAADSITAAKIDSRNLTIKDASGNVIFSAGTNLDWSRISSQPSGIFNSNITINGSGQLTGIGTGANTTVANNQITINANGTLSGAGGGQVSLSGLGAGALATANSVFVGSTVRFSDNSLMNTGDFVNRLSQITQGNVSTFIASGAIGEAYIGNLSAAKITSGTIASDRLDSTIINAKVTNIDAAVIGSGTIANARVGDIQSVNYVSGSTGWAIFKNIGNAEFSNVWVRGTSSVQRLVVTGAVSGSVFVANNSTATVTHNENRNIVVSIWSTAGSATLTDNSLNSFTVRLDNSPGGNVFYKYF